MDKPLRRELIDKGRRFIAELDRSSLEIAWKNHSEFLKRYPFREHPELIDQLPPEKIYARGAEDYFFLWVEHRTKELGAIFTYGGLVYPNAIKSIDKFKQLLKIAVDDSKSLSEKIDAPWEGINGFGGDKLIAKKIVFLYYPDAIVPIFKTDHLEYAVRKLGIEDRELDERARRSYKKEYSGLTLGQKYELLNNLLLEVKNSVEEFRDWDNACFMKFIYDFCSIPKRLPREGKLLTPLRREGLLFSPVDELGVACLFFTHHKELGFPYIVKASSKFPDVTAIDKDGETTYIELEYKSSDFILHGHSPEECDYIVCWEDDLEEKPDKFPEIISLKNEIPKLTEIRSEK
jgi:hypothetical protein